MKAMHSESSAHRFLLSTVAGLLLTAGSTVAVEKVFTIDPERSSITVSGTIIGAQAQEQAPGSLSTKLEGSLVVDLETTTIQFVAGSLIDAQTNGVWRPAAEGAPGSDWADFGAEGSIGFASGEAAARDIQLDVESGVIPLTGGSFDAASLVVFFPVDAPSVLDYRAVIFVVPQAGSLDLQGYATNDVATAATLVSEAGVETLTIPVDARYSFTLLTEDDTELNVVGQVVATAGAQEDLVVTGSLSGSGDELTLSWPGEEGDVFFVESLAEGGGWTKVAQDLTSVDGAVTWSTATDQPMQLFRVGKE